MISHDRALEALVRLLHGGILLIAIAAVLLMAPLIGARAWPTIVMFAIVAALTRTRASMWALLGADLLLALGLWWLFGPVSGASFIPYVVVSLGPLVLSPFRARVLLVAAVATVIAEAALHFASDFVALPLFHPPDPIPDGTFLAGIAIQLILLVGVGALMVRYRRCTARREGGTRRGPGAPARTPPLEGQFPGDRQSPVADATHCAARLLPPPPR